MFNKRAEGERLIHSRIYRYLTCYRYLFANTNKKNDRILYIQVANDKGDICFTLSNKETGEKQELVNPEAGKYEYRLTKGQKYVVVIKATGACGKYEITMKNV